MAGYIDFRNNGAAQGFQNALGLGLQLGSQAAEAANRRGYQNALLDYDPSKPDSWKEVAKYDSRAGFQLRQEAQQQQQQAELARDTELALGGDPEAKQRLIGRSFERWQAVDKQTKDQIAQEQELFGSAALYALSKGDPAAIRQEVINFAQQHRIPEAMELAQLPDDQLIAALKAQAFEAELTKELIAMEQPKYMAIPEGGTLVDTRNPQAVQQFGQQGRQAVRTGRDAQGRPVVQYSDGTIEYAGGPGGSAGGNFPGN